VAATVSPGDRVILLDPGYSLFSSVTLMAGGVPVYVPLNDTGHLDLERLRTELSQAKGLILVNPANPVGTVFTRTELEQLAELVVRTGTTIIADEVCDHFIFGEREFTSALSIECWRDQLIYCQSKTYAMTGWRVGYVIARAPLIDDVRLIHRTFVGAVNAAAQRAAIVALDAGDTLVKPMRETYQDRRDFIVARVNSIPGMQAPSPEGGLDAIRAGTRKLVVLTEHVPYHDVMYVLAEAAEHGTQVLGPNTAGLVVPGEASVGIMPGFATNIFRPGRIGVVSRSGSLGTLMSLNLVGAGYGQSAFIGIGGDPILGTTTLDAVRDLDADERIDAVVLVGEIGGTMEEEAAEYISTMDKPVVAFIAGRSAPPDRRMGHAGAIVTGGRGSGTCKVASLTEAGSIVVDVPGQVAEALRSR
jgi:succinyl-CoA synthetase alpha subunit